MDFEKARFNMVEQQIRPWEVLDQRVLDLFARVPRERYVPEAYRELAYADIEIPLPDGQRMLTPKVQARMLQALQVGPEDRVLEVGTGSGYGTALLAALGRHVVSVEISPVLHERAREILAREGVENVTLLCGDGSRGWPELAPYEAIALTGSVPVLDEQLVDQLVIGGRVFAVVGRAPAMEAVLLTRAAEDQWATEPLFETVVPPLQGVEVPEPFEL